VTGFLERDLAVVTGAGSGVGRSVATILRSRGVDVVGVDTSPDESLDVSWVEGDVAANSTWNAVLAACAERERGATLLVINAAVVHVGSVLDLGDAEWQHTLEVNLLGGVRAMRALLPGMQRLGRGSIVTVASVDAFMAEQGLAAYCSSKGALLQLARCSAVDFARDGIRVNCVCPGVIDTPFFRRHLATASDPERFLEVRKQRNPLGRLLMPEDVAETVVFLLSDASAGTTGAQFTVDAGLTASFDFRTGDEGA
jgi:NAD(P)-dependent dehydrogenase (short-subunit alcohol dehydrogenase family)